MSHLSLSLLGSFQVTLDGQPATGFKSNKVRALLAYLAVEADRPHRREALAGLLWPDWPDRDAISNLRYALSDLRGVIGDREAQPPYLLITRDTIQFNLCSDHWLDVWHFTENARVDKSALGFFEILEKAIVLYRGDFLEGFSLEDSSTFEEWTLLTRERFARQASTLLHTLADFCEARGDYEQALAYAYRQLELEPWNETAHQQLMRVLALNGQRSAALAQYENCRSVLADELGVEPSEETEKLHEQIKSSKLKAQKPFSLVESDFKGELPSFLKEEPQHIEIPIVVARERELSQLDSFLGKALLGQGCAVFVTGEAGSGKTTLVQEFSRQAQSKYADLIVANGNCNAYTGVGDPYLPFREVLDLLSGGIEAKLAVGAMNKEHALRLWNTLPWTVQALVETGPDLIDTFVLRDILLERARVCAPHRPEWMIQLERLIESKPSVSHSSTGIQQSDLFEQYTRVLQTLTHHNPLLLILDDLQWADLGSISLLFHLGRRLAGNRLLVLGTYRPEDVAIEQAGERHSLESVVNEFQRMFGNIEVNVDQAKGQDFIDAFLDSEPNRLNKPFREMLFGQTHGHPLFTVELLHGLQERGDLVQDSDGFWVEGRSLDWDNIPARVEAAIRERVNRLSDSLQRILSVASVEGEDFTAEVLAQVLGLDGREIVQSLSSELVRKHRLISAKSIERIGMQRISRYRFKSYLFQKYLYDSLGDAERAYLHEDVGNSLVNIYGERANQIAVQLARHFHEAKIIEKAIHYLHQAGIKAVQLSAYQEGIAHLSRGLTLLEMLPDPNVRDQLELDLQLALGIAIVGPKGFVPEVERAHIRARELCQKMGNTTQLCRVVGEMSLYHYVRAEYKPALELAEEAFSLAQEVEDPLLVSLAHWILGFINFCLGDYTLAQNHLEKVIDFYDPEQHHHAFIALQGSDAGVSALAYYACGLWCLGYPDQAMQRSQEALALARELGHPFTLIDVVSYAGCLFNMMRRHPQALLENANEMKQLAEDKLHGWLGQATWQQGEAMVMLGHIEEGIAQIQKGLDLNKFSIEKVHWSGALYALADAQAKLGHLQKGLNIISEALTFVDERDERYYEAELYRLKGKLLIVQGNQAEAETCLHRAIEVARGQQAKLWELRAVMELCHLWQKQEKFKEAHQILSEIYSWFTEGFDTQDLTDAKLLLQELG